MDLRELENYRLDDAVKFNDRLNPRIWGPDERMLPKVRERLLAIADDFRESLGIDVEVKDITVSGSNAAYTYTDHSDIDLHLVTDLPQADASEVYRELFDAKKYQYNDQHDFKIGGYDVELYVQDARKPHHSQGIYSIMNDDWVRVPSRRRPEVNDISVRSKYEDLGARIESAIESGDLGRMDAVSQKIKQFRQAGLDQHGEFGPENLAFKILRGNGTLQRLRDARLAAKDREMSLTERGRKKSRRRWGRFGGYFYPGFGYGGSTEGGDGGGDGGGESQREDYDPNAEPPGPEFKPEMPAGTILVNVSDVYDWYKLGQDISDLGHADPQAYGKGAPQTILSFGSEPIEHLYKQNLDKLGLKTFDIDRRAKSKDPEGAFRMDEDQDPQRMLERFVAFAAGQLGIEELPRMKWRRDPAWSERNNTFGRYRPEENTLYVSLANRHPLDIMRTIAHELTHHRQNEKEPMPDHAGDTGSDWENEANARAGIIMRRFADLHPEMFGIRSLAEPMDEDLKTKLGAAAAAACVAGTPGCATTDVTAADALRGVQTVGRVARNLPTRAGAEEELRTAVKDVLRKGTGTRESRVQEASGYIPTAAEKDDPRYSMALTVDVRPGETGRQANKLGLKTDGQGRPQLLMKKLQNLLSETKLDEKCWTGYRKQGMKTKGGRQVPNCVKVDEDQDLFEVKMSPGELEKWAQSEEAEGIQAGFEAEMIFRDTTRGDEEDQEPDYDADERPRSIDDVVDFFSNDDYGFGIGRNTANRLRDGLYEEFVDWREEAIGDAWSSEEEAQVRDYMESNVWGDDTEQDQYRERAAADLGIDTSEESAEQAVAIETRARELFDEDVDEAISDQNQYYEDAREYYRDMMADSGDYDEEEFFSNRYPYMTDVAEAYELEWPVWTGGGYQGGRNIEDVAESLRKVVNAEVRASDNYHGAARRPGRWIIEPDGSLEPDDETDAGLEIVSPPMPLADALANLRRVIDWGNGPADAYTNDSTGLHMGVSIPHKGGDVDYVKLILFMGDQYVLDRFGRAANSYCRSALDKLQSIQRSRRQGMMEATKGQEKTAAAMDLMKKNLIELASQYVRGGVGQDKYTSAHMKDDYIEFRSPGGDYLAMDSRDEDALQNTMLRFARAMYLAGRPDLERKEYGKKLYKLIDAQGDDALGLFLKYSTGEIGPEMLKKEWARQVLAKEAPDKNTWEVVKKTGEDDRGEPTYEVLGTVRADNRREAEAKVTDEFEQWWRLEVRPKLPTFQVIRRDTGEVIDTIRSDSQGEASELAQQKYAGQGFDWYVRSAEEAPREPSRRAKVAKKIVDRPTIWRITDTDSGRTLLVAAQNAALAKIEAERQDEHWWKLRRNDPDAFLAEPATREEVVKYQRQQLDQKQDSREIEKTVNDGRPLFPYTVTWRETRDGREFGDSLNLDAESADAAVDNIRRTLGYMGRTVIPGSIQARPREEAGYEPGASRQDQPQREYHIVNPDTGMPVVAFMAATDREAYERIEQYRQQHPSINVSLRTGGASVLNPPVPGSTLDRARQRADQEAQQRAAWTGRWQVRNARTGEVVYTFSGAGNNQGDANRIAQRWVQQSRYDDPVEVVPERGTYGSEN